MTLENQLPDSKITLIVNSQSLSCNWVGIGMFIIANSEYFEKAGIGPKTISAGNNSPFPPAYDGALSFGWRGAAFPGSGKDAALENRDDDGMSNSGTGSKRPPSIIFNRFNFVLYLAIILHLMTASPMEWTQPSFKIASNGAR